MAKLPSSNSGKEKTIECVLNMLKENNANKNSIMRGEIFQKGEWNKASESVSKKISDRWSKMQGAWRHKKSLIFKKIIIAHITQ